MANSRDNQDKNQLEAIARDAMRTYGLEPDFPAAARAQLAHLQPKPQNGLRDLRSLPWSSIDNDDSRDLDQIWSAEPMPDGASTMLVAIADVDALVRKGLAARRARGGQHDVGLHAGADLSDAARGAVDRSNVAERGRRSRRRSSSR